MSALRKHPKDVFFVLFSYSFFFAFIYFFFSQLIFLEAQSLFPRNEV